MMYICYIQNVVFTLQNVDPLRDFYSDPGFQRGMSNFFALYAPANSRVLDKQNTIIVMKIQNQNTHTHKLLYNKTVL